MGQPVKLEIADPIDHFLAAATAARQHLDAREQLGERIGLGQIIVAAGAQSLDPVIDLAERRQNERRRLDALAAQGADHREPVELRQHAIDDQDVVLAVHRQREPLLAVGGEVGNVPDLAEGLDQIVGGIAIVFDDQQTHDGPAISTVGAFPHCGGTFHREFIIAATLQQVANADRNAPPRGRKERGVAEFPPPPLNNSGPAGATDARPEL